MDNKNNNQTNIDSEIIAVITAALTALEENTGIKLSISNIRRLPQSAPAWGLAGRAERMAQKLNGLH